LIAMSPPAVPSEPPRVVQKVLSMAQPGEPARAVESAALPSEEPSGVYLRLLNQPGVVREVCSPVTYNRCC
jgi:hypothetical protein